MANTPITPNFNPNTNPGRLATDRYDFESHIQGTKFRHNANQIDLFPIVSIDGYNKTTVQDAISAIASALSPPVIPDATTTTKGIIQLTGDISGSATNIIVSRLQGKPVSTLSPSLNDVLTWNGSTWTPSPATNAFTANGDLAGNNIVQTVVNLSGSGGLLTASCDTIRFNTSVTNPTLTQSLTSIAGGTSLSLMAQSSSLASAKGGDVIISGGSPGAGGLKGGVKLQLDSGNGNLVQATEVASGRRVLSLVHPNDLTITDMSAGTGDMVIYIRDAASAPSAGSTPVNGSILYSQSGKLHITQGDGANFTIGEIPNPSIWGVLSASPQQGQTITYRVSVTSTSAVPQVLYSFNLTNKVATKIDAVIVGKQDALSETAQFNLSMGYVRQDSAVPATQDVGIVSSTDSRTTSTAATWIVPTISRVGNTITVYSGANAATTIYWFAVIQISLSLSST